MAERPLNVLFLCTHNSARACSPRAAEPAGRGRLKAYSAGSHPPGGVNPFAIEALSVTGSTRRASQQELGRVHGARRAAARLRHHGMRQAAGETCPVFGRASRSRRTGASRTRPPRGRDEEKRKASSSLHPAQHRLDCNVSARRDGPHGAARQRWTTSVRMRDGRTHDTIDQSSPLRRQAPDATSIFERYLTLWVFLCIVVGIVLGQCSRAVPGDRPRWSSRRSIFRSGC